MAKKRKTERAPDEKDRVKVSNRYRVVNCVPLTEPKPIPPEVYDGIIDLLMPLALERMRQEDEAIAKAKAAGDTPPG